MENFDLTGNYKHPKSHYPDITFYPATGEAPILWYERGSKSGAKDRKTYESERDQFLNFIRENIIPIVEENLKKTADIQYSFCSGITDTENPISVTGDKTPVSEKPKPVRNADKITSPFMRQFDNLTLGFLDVL